MLKQKPDYAYSTDTIELAGGIFQSMVHNLGDKIKKMKVKITLKNLEEKKDFEISEHRAHEREDAVELSSSEEESDEDSEEQFKKEGDNIRPKGKVQFSKMKENADIRSIPVSFELSILLRQKYFETLEKIGKRLDVRFMVVPNKVKIIGWKTELVDQAEEQFSHIQDKIRFIPISKGGKEAYLSKIYKKLLQEHQIEIVKILNKYYLWYEEGIPDPTDILRYTLNDTTHILVYLNRINFDMKGYKQFRQNQKIEDAHIAHGTIVERKKNPHAVKELLSQLKAQIFDKYVENQINRREKKEERKIELSQDQKYLLLHLDSEEQLDIHIGTISELYQPFQYTILSFDISIEMQMVKKFLEEYSKKGRGGFKKRKEEGNTGLFFEVSDHLVCIAYLNKTETGQIFQVQNHELMKIFKDMPEELKRFEVAIQAYLNDPQDEPTFKKFAFEKDRLETVTFIRCKNPSSKNYELLLTYYIENKFDELRKNYTKELNNAKTDVSQSVEISMSRPIDETSMLFNDTVNNEIGKENDNQKSMIKVLPPEILNTSTAPMFKFEQYDFCLLEKEEEREKRFSEDLDKVKRKAVSYSNPDNDEKIKAQTKCKLKIYKLTIPSKYKVNLETSVQKILEKDPSLANYNRYVTVFYGGKEPKDYQNLYDENSFLKVLRMNDNNNIKEGYLLRTNVLLMYVQFQEKNTVELPFGDYEAMYFVKKIE